MHYIETKKGLETLLKRTKEYGEKPFTKKDSTSMNSPTGERQWKAASKKASQWMRSTGRMHLAGSDHSGEGSSNEEGRIKAWQ